MKRLAILSSLALIVAPTFSGSGVSDLAKNQIRFAEETGGSSNYIEKTGTIYFGEQNSTSGTPFSDSNVTKYYKAEGFDDKLTPSFTKYVSCFSAGERGDNSKSESGYYNLRFGQAKETAELEITFTNGIILSSVTVSAKAYSSNQSGGTFSLSLDDTLKGTSKSITDASTYQDISFANLNSGAYNSYTKILFKKATAGKKNEYFSKIVFKYFVKNEVTVTYDYGDYKNDSWKTSETILKGEKATPDILPLDEYSDWIGKHTLFFWLDDNGNEFDFTTSVIENNITVHAMWDTEESDKTAEFKNIGESKTKSQLFYEFSNEKTEITTLTFGDTDYSSAGDFDTDNFKKDGDLAIESVSSTYCYAGTAGTNALRVGSANNSGTFKLDFAETIVKEVSVYAKPYGTDETNLSCKLVSSANSNTDSQTIKKTTTGTFEKYTYLNLDNGKNDKSTSITFGEVKSAARQRISIQKIEIVTVDLTADNSTYYVSNMGLRFGGAIAKDHYEAATQNETGKTVKDHVKSVGMIWTTALPETTDGKAYDSLTAAIEAGAITETNTHIKTMDVAEKELVLDGDYYRYNCSISVSEASINTEIYAVATMTFDNGLTIYLEETSNSVVTIAKKYVEDTTTYNTYSEPIQKTLKALSEGKTSVAIA